ncbi:MAG: hypothetical protein IPM39_21935 [Chloroflexi bacterium]|nr:hypothetical protein [Chloroflexota bacterium]
MSRYRMLSLGGAVLLVVLLAGCAMGDQQQATTDSAAADNTATAAAVLLLEQTTSTAAAATAQTATAVAATISAQTAATAQAEAAQTSAAATGEAEAAANATSAAVTAAALAQAATATWVVQTTETVVALRTARAEQAATATAVFVAEHEALINDAKTSAPIYGPRSGELVHDEDDFIEESFAGVNVRNFVAEATFILDPAAGQIGDRDFGFTFRDRTAGAWRLIVMRSRVWELARYDDDEYDLVKSGRYPPGIFADRNTLTLYVNDEAGFFFLNGRFISAFSLIGGQETGNVAAALGFYATTEKKGEVTQFEDFTIWPLGEPPAAPGPASTVAPRATAPPPGFDATAMMNSLNNLRLTIENIGGLLDRLYYGQSQSCQEYLGYYQALQQRTTHSNLPPAWQGIYNEYNVAADNIISTNATVKNLCETGGGYISEFDYGVARQGIGASLDRINQAIQAANGLLNQ